MKNFKDAHVYYDISVNISNNNNNNDNNNCKSNGTCKDHLNHHCCLHFLNDLKINSLNNGTNEPNQIMVDIDSNPNNTIIKVDGEVSQLTNKQIDFLVLFEVNLPKLVKHLPEVDRNEYIENGKSILNKLIANDRKTPGHLQLLKNREMMSEYIPQVAGLNIEYDEEFWYSFKNLFNETINTAT